MFYNQPVRRRLLNASPRKIMQSVKEYVMRYVLIHPQVAFTVTDLTRKDIILLTNSAGSLNSTLCNLFGADTFSKLQEIDYAQGHLRLTGFLSKTYHSHPSKALQYFSILPVLFFNVSIVVFIIWEAAHIPFFNVKTFWEELILKSREQAEKSHQDWEPVVTCVRNAILKIWGDRSVGGRQGYMKITPSSGNSRHSKSCNTRNARRDGALPMSVRRTLVQIDSQDKQETNEEWWDADSFVPQAPLWSPSNDSVDIPRILNTSDSLPEISSFVEELASGGEHPS